MRKLEIYVETSVWNAPFSTQSSEFKELSASFFADAVTHDIFISTIVRAEIERCPEPKRAKIFGLLGEFSAIELEISDEVEALSEKYIEYGIIPARYYPDALHIAVASANDLDYIVSLNFAHIVREKTRDGIIGINAIVGVKAPKIISPGEI